MTKPIRVEIDHSRFWQLGHPVHWHVYVSKELRDAGIPVEGGLQFQGETIDMILNCPACGLQHIDAPSDDAYDGNPPSWTNPPHRSHLCHGCGHIWRPADVPTNGVAEIKTKGKNDSPAPDDQPMTEEQSYAIEALWQFLPELKAREDHLIVLTPMQLETMLRRLGWRAPCDARKGRV